MRYGARSEGRAAARSRTRDDGRAADDAVGRGEQPVQGGVRTGPVQKRPGGEPPDVSVAVADGKAGQVAEGQETGGQCVPERGDPYLGVLAGVEELDEPFPCRRVVPCRERGADRFEALTVVPGSRQGDPVQGVRVQQPGLRSGPYARQPGLGSLPSFARQQFLYGRFLDAAGPREHRVARPASVPAEADAQCQRGQGARGAVVGPGEGLGEGAAGTFAYSLVAVRAAQEEKRQRRGRAARVERRRPDPWVGVAQAQRKFGRGRRASPGRGRTGGVVRTRGVVHLAPVRGGLPVRDLTVVEPLAADPEPRRGFPSGDAAQSPVEDVRIEPYPVLCPAGCHRRGHGLAVQQPLTPAEVPGRQQEFVRHGTHCSPPFTPFTWGFPVGEGG